MTIFKKLKKMKTILSEIPGIRTCKDFEILIEIGYHQEEGRPLTLKQLALLDIASKATVRRYLYSLVRDGMVEKFESANDQRSVMLRLSAATIKTLSAHFSRLIKQLGDHPGTSSKPRSGKSTKG